MKYLKIFENQSAYSSYITGDDIWLPRVSHIINGGEDPDNENEYSDTGPSRVEYSRIGAEFIQVANDGVMYMTDQVYEIGGEPIAYTAAINGETIVIKTKNLTTNELTNDAYIDEENESIVINYPSGQMTYSLP